MKFLAILLTLLPAAMADYKVPLEIHIMSQCPDATYAFVHLISPTLEQISPLVNYTQSFIGTPTASGVACKHGPSECLGNMLHLCAAKLTAPSLDYLPFSRALLEEYGKVTDQDFIKSAAEKAGIDFDELNRCVSDIGPGGGMDLLVTSVERTEEAGVKKSCTVRVEGEVVCVRDDGQWKDCPHGSGVKDLVRLVKEAHQRGAEKVGLVEQVGEMRDAGKIIWTEL